MTARKNGVEEREALNGKRTLEFFTDVNKKLKSSGCDEYSGKWGSAFLRSTVPSFLQIILKMEGVCSSTKLVPMYVA